MHAPTLALMLAATTLASCTQASNETSLPAEIEGERTFEQFTLDSDVFGNSRAIYVSLPPGYGDDTRSYPVFYFTDGRPAMDEPAWNVPNIASQLEGEGLIPTAIYVGIDNGGATSTTSNPSVDRASEFLPYPDPSWVDEPIPVPRGNRYDDFLVDEVIPAVEARFRASNDPDNRGLAGASFGAIAALYTVIQEPDAFSMLLLESPSLHVGEGRMLEDSSRLRGWNGRVHIGVGTAEGEPEIAAMMTDLSSELARILACDVGVPTSYLEVEGAEHWYSFWAERLDEALRFLTGADGAGDAVDCPS